jgi:hypothetical protein
MKNFLKSKFGIAILIILVAGAVAYLTTWGNKSWLIDEIIDKGGVPNSKESRDQLALKSTSSLRGQLKGMM